MGLVRHAREIAHDPLSLGEIVFRFVVHERTLAHADKR